MFITDVDKLVTDEIKSIVSRTRSSHSKRVQVKNTREHSEYA